MLEKKFIHKSWYIKAGLTVKEFLELASINESFYATKKIAKDQDNNFFSDIKYINILKNEEDNGYYILNEQEFLYYITRKQFWKEWKKEYSIKNPYNPTNNNEALYFESYINELSKAKEKENTYKIAKNKVKKSLNKRQF